jgi:hypothetical protein
MVLEALAFLLLVGVIAALGLRVGMLVAPRLERLAGDHDEEPRVDD